MSAWRRRTPTAFQSRVYAVVQRIPKGEVRSYQWVARQLGNAQLARAVGGALRCNPDPKRIPCHRVIRSDGTLGGYAWGPSRKRALLRLEDVKGQFQNPRNCGFRLPAPRVSWQAGIFDCGLVRRSST